MSMQPQITERLQSAGGIQATEYSYVLENNPDDEYFRKKKKMIKKNNGYCIGVPKTEEWKCPCKSFREKQEEGWCGEGLYYKRFIGPDANNTNGTKEEQP